MPKAGVSNSTGAQGAVVPECLVQVVTCRLWKLNQQPADLKLSSLTITTKHNDITSCTSEALLDATTFLNSQINSCLDMLVDRLLVKSIER